MGYTLGQLAELTGAQLRGPADQRVAGVATLATAGPEQLGFLANPKYRELLLTTSAGAVIVSPDDSEAWPGPALVSPNPYLVFARVSALFSAVETREPGVHVSAVVDSTARISPKAYVSAGAYIGANVEVGDGASIGPNCTVEANSRIGAGSTLVANVTICQGVRIGERCLLHPGVVIGADGFGQARDGDRWVKVPQLGSVRIGNGVEIGANTTVDRGALEDTVIEDGVKLDNQIQVAHNVHIGANTAIAGCTAIAGSSVIGKRCMIAGGVGIAGHLEIADDVTVLAMTLVTHSIRDKGVYSGSHPMADVRSWRRNSARVRQLDDIAKRLQRLEKQWKQDKEEDE